MRVREPDCPALLPRFGAFFGAFVHSGGAFRAFRVLAFLFGAFVHSGGFIGVLGGGIGGVKSGAATAVAAVGLGLGYSGGVGGGGGGLGLGYSGGGVRQVNCGG